MQCFEQEPVPVLGCQGGTWLGEVAPKTPRAAVAIVVQQRWARIWAIVAPAAAAPTDRWPDLACLAPITRWPSPGGRRQPRYREALSDPKPATTQPGD